MRHVFIPEDLESGSLIARLISTDYDSSSAFSRINYSLTDGDPNLFQVDSGSGSVSLSGHLDADLATAQFNQFSGKYYVLVLSITLETLFLPMLDVAYLSRHEYN
ncbi:unnamed protein product [Protopolystoma xenopodis]|uniref:Cadherin domain-containing protein n=1 Tax=Protopolystoma xenopodis TaxID=117903 RepID=A0A448WXD2_9PLAT|nr:unnamed protein product [Protopolystoma xenopodis]